MTYWKFSTQFQFGRSRSSSSAGIRMPQSADGSPDTWSERRETNRMLLCDTRSWDQYPKREEVAVDVRRKARVSSLSNWKAVVGSNLGSLTRARIFRNKLSERLRIDALLQITDLSSFTVDAFLIEQKRRGVALSSAYIPTMSRHPL
jgi:hypothetical protein